MLVFAISMALFFYFGYILGNSNKEEYATHRFVELIITAANEGIVTMNFDNAWHEARRQQKQEGGQQ